MVPAYGPAQVPPAGTGSGRRVAVPPGFSHPRRRHRHRSSRSSTDTTGRPPGSRSPPPGCAASPDSNSTRSRDPAVRRRAVHRPPVVGPGARSGAIRSPVHRHPTCPPATRYAVSTGVGVVGAEPPDDVGGAALVPVGEGRHPWSCRRQAAGRPRCSRTAPAARTGRAPRCRRTRSRARPGRRPRRRRRASPRRRPRRCPVRAVGGSRRSCRQPRVQPPTPAAVTVWAWRASCWWRTTPRSARR